MYLMPESPTWLVRHGKRNEARKALVWLRGPDYDVEKELAFIDHSLASEKQRAGHAPAGRTETIVSSDEEDPSAASIARYKAISNRLATGGSNKGGI
jgi:hypothetical protein